MPLQKAISARERRFDLVVNRLGASGMTLDGPVLQILQLWAIQRRFRKTDAALIEHDEIPTGGEVARERAGNPRTKAYRERTNLAPLPEI